MKFETEYKLQLFREIQNEHFDSDGHLYGGVNHGHMPEQMLVLVNALEKEIKDLETTIQELNKYAQ